MNELRRYNLQDYIDGKIKGCWLKEASNLYSLLDEALDKKDAKNLSRLYRYGIDNNKLLEFAHRRFVISVTNTGDLKLIEALFNISSKYFEYGLIKAITNDQKEVVNYFLEKEAKLPDTDAIISISNRASPEMIRYLMGKIKDPDVLGEFLYTEKKDLFDEIYEIVSHKITKEDLQELITDIALYYEDNPSHYEFLLSKLEDLSKGSQ